MSIRVPTLTKSINPEVGTLGHIIVTGSILVLGFNLQDTTNKRAKDDILLTGPGTTIISKHIAGHNIGSVAHQPPCLF